MIRGSVIDGRGAVLPLSIRGPGGSNIDVNAVIDTEFSGCMTLPTPLATALGLVTKTGGTLVLADGTPRDSDLCIAEVLWDGAWHSITAWALGDEVLIGMNMLDGFRMVIDAVAGGAVEISPLP